MLAGWPHTNRSSKWGGQTQAVQACLGFEKTAMTGVAFAEVTYLNCQLQPEQQFAMHTVRVESVGRACLQIVAELNADACLLVDRSYLKERIYNAIVSLWPPSLSARS